MRNITRSVSAVMLLAPAVALGQIEINTAVYSADEMTLVVAGKSKSHAAVSLTDAISGLDLGTATVEGNAFQFHVLFAGARRAPCEVRVEAGNDSVFAEVHKAPENCSHIVFQLDGVVDAPFAGGASVTATVGGSQFQSVADTEGAFEVTMASLYESSVIGVTAGPGGTAKSVMTKTASGLRLAAVAGPVSQFIETAAGAKSTSDPDTTIDAISTARWALLNDISGGEPQTLDELITAEKSVSADQLLELAAVIKLIVEDPNFDLPAGYDDLLTFVSDETAVDQFITDTEAQDPNALADMQDTILAEASLSNAFDPTEIPSRYYVIPAAVPGFISRQGELSEFFPDGTGVLVSKGFGGAGELPYAWTVTDGDLVLTYDQPIVSRFIFPTELSSATDAQKQALLAEGIVFLDAEYTTEERRYILVSDGFTVDIASQVTELDIVYDPVELSDGSVIQLEPQLYPSAGTVELRDGDALPPLPFSEEMVAGQRWALLSTYDPGPWFFTAASNAAPLGLGLYGDLLFFNADASCGAEGTCTGGSGLAEVSGMLLSWQIDSTGDLIVDFANGDRMTVRLLEQQDQAFGAMYLIERIDGGLADYHLAIRQDPALALTAGLLETPVGSFWNALINAWNFGAYDENGELRYFLNFGWSFNNDGSGANHSFSTGDFNGDGTVDRMHFIRNTGWTSAADGSASVSAEWYSACISAGVDCHRRHWTPLAQNADGTLYVFEESEGFTFWEAPSEQEWLLYSTGRVNFWVQMPFPDSDLTMP